MIQAAAPFSSPPPTSPPPFFNCSFMFGLCNKCHRYKKWKQQASTVAEEIETWWREKINLLRQIRKSFEMSVSRLLNTNRTNLKGGCGLPK